ncbi:MAG: hypothetical protein ABW123_10055 [Cystobacter sp.]
MKRLALPALLALAVTGCQHARAPVSEVAREDDAGKCALVQTLVREQLPRDILSGLESDHDGPSQVLVFVRGEDEAVLERLFSGDPSCRGSNFKVVQEITREALVLFLERQGAGFVYDAQRAAPDRMSLGGKARGTVTKRSGVWAASSI